MAGPRTKLGEQYVRFTVDGLDKAEKDTTKTAGKVSSTWLGLGKKLATGFRTAFTGLRGISEPIAGLRGLVNAAAEGTREAEQMSTAWTYLNRSVGEMFAPTMRVAIQLVVRIADAFRRLSPETKTWIVLVALAAGGIVALAGAVTIASVAFGALAAVAGVAWAVITSPVVLVTAGIIALGAGILFLIGKMEELWNTGQVSSKGWVESIISGGRIVATTTATTINFLTNKFAEFMNWLTSKAASASDALGFSETAERIRKLKIDAGKLTINTSDIDKGFKDAEEWVKKSVPGIGEIGKMAKNALKDLKGVPGLLGQLLSGEGGEGMKFRPQLKVGFEGLQQTFDRLQEAFAAGTEEDKLNQIRDEGKKTNEILDKILGKIGLGGVLS